jgi:hypothetical protein
MRKGLSMVHELARTKDCVSLRQDPIPATLSRRGSQAISVPSVQMDARLFSLVHAWFQPSWILLIATPVKGLTAHMHRALPSGDADLPFPDFYRMHDLLSKSLAIERAALVLMGAMATLALVLSTIGLFVLVANIAAQRTHAFLQIINRRNAGPVVLCFNEDLTGSVGKIEKLYVDRLNLGTPEVLP